MKKLFWIMLPFVFSVVAFAEENSAAVADAVGAVTTSGGGITDKGVKYFSYFFAVALAAFGGVKGQSNAAATALEGIGRNPNAADKMGTPMILALALMESLVIFTFATVFVAG
jgi:F-type H+-transporting ATPase subunit c